MTESAQIDPAASPAPTKLGRKPDPALAAKILDAALDVLAETGYPALTVDEVAARAGAGKAAIYRRWSSKEDMLADAVVHLRERQAAANSELPDTGTLRGDLLALFRPQSADEVQHLMALMAGLVSMMSTHRSISTVVDDFLVTPWADAHVRLMRRAQERGEISPRANVETVARVLPSVSAYRTLVLREPFTEDFLVQWVDDVLLPALSGGPDTSDH